MGDHGIKITKPFIDATSGNPEDYIVWSKYKHLKITKRISGKLTIPDSSSSVTGAISHGITYEPAFLCYFKYPNQTNWWIVGSDLGTLSDYFDDEYDSQCRADKEKFNLSAARGGVDDDQDFPYVIYMFDQTAAMGYSGSGKPPGYQTSDCGIKVSQKDIDVRTANLYELMVNSNCDHLKYHKTFTGSLSYDTSENGEDKDVIAHGLPYTPLFMAYGKNFYSSWYVPLPSGRVPNPAALSAAVGKQNIIVELIWAGSASPSSGTIQYRVVVFKNRLIG